MGYTDANGVAQHSLFFDFGDGEYYSTKDSESWTRGLRPMSPWLKTLLLDAKASQAPAVVDAEDAVDVMGAG